MRTQLFNRFPTIVATFACVALSGCSLIEPSAARTNSAYRAKAIKTADAATSGIQTAILTIHLLDTAKITANTAAVHMADAADSAGGAHHAFDRVQPPSTIADDVQTSLDQILNDVDSEMSSTLTSIRRHNFSDIDDNSEKLKQLSEQLSQFSAEQH